MSKQSGKAEDFYHIERPLNDLAEILEKNLGKDLNGRRIRVTTEISDIAVGKHSIRVHPDMVAGADLTALFTEEIFPLVHQFDNAVWKRLRRKCIKETRERLETDIGYLLRHDEEGLAFIRGLLPSTNGTDPRTD